MARPRIAAIAVRLLPLAVLCAASAASAQVYMGTASNGTVVLSNHGGVDAPLLLLAPEEEPKAAAGADDAGKPPPPLPLSGEIRAAAQRHALPESLLAAVIAVESGFNPKAVSPKGAKGLMQLMPETARRFGVKDIFAVQENIDGGAAYLRWLLTQFDNDLQLALAAYNAGEGAVARAGRRIPAYAETQDYVAKVLARMAMR